MIANRNSLLVFLFNVALCCATMVSAQTAVPSVRNFREVAISPDGNRLAWVEPIMGEAGSRAGTAIYVQNLVQDLKSPDSKPRRISAGNGGANANSSDQSVVWAPDSKRLAFLSDADSSGQSQLYVAEADGTHKLTSLKGFLSNPAWSPDGKTVAILFTEDAPRAAGPLQAMTPETGQVESKIYEQRVTVVDVASGNVRQCSPADMYVYEYDWSPDSKSFAII